MSQEKMKNLVKYQNELKNKLSSTDIPEKHKHRPVHYKKFLENELSTTTKKLEELKLQGAK